MTDAPICIKETYVQFCEDIGLEDAADLLRIFLEDTEAKTRALPAMEKRLDVKCQAHAIKSSAATFGFARLSGLARALEADAEKLGATELHQAIEGLRQAFEATEDFANRELLAAHPAAA